jgi:hypothetical protein
MSKFIRAPIKKPINRINHEGIRFFNLGSLKNNAIFGSVEILNNNPY